MMNRKLAQGRHVEWLRTSPHSSETDPGERSDHSLSGLAELFIDSCRKCRRAAIRVMRGRGRFGASRPSKLRSVALVPGTVFKRYGPLSLSAASGDRPGLPT